VTKMPTATEMKPILEESIQKLEKWVENHNYRGYEPFDGLSSFLRPLTFGNLFLERLLQQVVRQSPIDLRPLLGIKPQESTKGRGYMAWGYLKMFKITGDPAYKQKAFTCLDWLDRNKAPGYSCHSWANSFDFSSRGGRLPKNEPIIVWTSLIGHAFLEAYEMFAEERHLEIIRSISSWVLSLPRERTHRGDCLSYYAFGEHSIHNSNMLGAGFLASAAKFTKDPTSLEVARSAMEYSCSRQISDGSWYYGEDPRHRWIDCFHTGYNLDSLKRYIEFSGDTTFETNLERGFEYFKNHFFEANGSPRYYHNRLYPIDIQCASQAIDTLVLFADRDSDAAGLAHKVAQWTINNMQDRDGHFWYRVYPLGIKARAPMMHWGQATMYKALSALLHRIHSASDGALEKGST
jgi:rhamnogalacturonyl hydrolase YesR